MRGRPLLVAAALVVAATIVGGLPAAAAPPGRPAAQAAPTACPPSPFPAGLDRALSARWPGQRFTASVTDRATGCTWDLRPGERLTTASVLKAEILAGLLLRAQAAGRGLTQWERDRILPMIAESADPPANELWSSLGGVAGMQRVDAAFGLTQTVQRSPWGLTTTSARDRSRLMRLLVAGDGGPLRAEYRAEARRFLLSVVPSQRWGAPAGVRPGTPVPMKNGFFSSQCCRWRVNTSGLVEAPGGGYALTILSDRWPSLQAGIPAVEMVARSVASRLGGPYSAFASPAGFVDRQVADVLGRPATYEELAWVTAVVGWDGSRAPGAVADLLASPAYATLGPPLLRIYLAALHRWPPGSRFAYRLYQLRTGSTSLRAVAEDAAHEITGPGGITPDAFVDQVVQQVMGYPPDAAGRAYWAARLRGGTATRGDVLRAYVESPASRARQQVAVVVGTTYLQMLGRAPDEAALAYWTERGGVTVAQVAAVVLGSAEYRARVGG